MQNRSNMKMTLNELTIGETARVIRVGGEGALRQHFLDMGIIPGTEMMLQKLAPMGDPAQYFLHGYELTLRLADAAQIQVEPCKASLSSNETRILDSEHPGLGEMGRYHDKTHENPLPNGTQISLALVGNQNTGKTTLFNQLTGANQHVGNFPGVTVDKKSGPVRRQINTIVTDLPGIYSLSPYTSEEVVSRKFILEEHPHGIINIVDATNIERNLYLTLQLMELGVPTVLALNMMDELEGNGGTIDVNRMERLLGIPVVPISAAKGQGVGELVEHVMHITRYQEVPARTDFCSPQDHNGAVHRSLHAIMHLIEDHAQRIGIPVRFAANKLAEGDVLVANALDLSQNEKETIEHILLQMEEERGLDRAAAMADMRFSFIKQLTKSCVIPPRESRERDRSMMADIFLTGKWTAIPAFIMIMVLMFWMTFDVIGGNLQDVISNGIDSFTKSADNYLTNWKVDPVLHSLIINGIFSGIGTILTFVPIIITLFFFLSLLEDSGYMARIAFIMDKMLRKIGLSGRSIVPLLIGFGCSVPSVMSSRTLPSERDRRLTILLIPFMSCTAKLPIYAFFCAAFFPGKALWVMLGLYILAIIVGIIVACIRKMAPHHRGEPVPFVMELPNYRLPSLKSVGLLLWDKTRDFIERAFTIIFLASIAIWFLQSFNLHMQLVGEAQDSILAQLADGISPLLSPLGFGDWRMTTALVSGFMAKETVVSTLVILYGGTGAITSGLTTAGALSFLVFCLLYTPCVATIAAVKRELGVRYAVRMVLAQCGIAWIVAFVIYQAFTLFSI